MIAALPDEAPDLSQRLAEHGLLPMFGFPTAVRELHTTPAAAVRDAGRRRTPSTATRASRSPSSRPATRSSARSTSTRRSGSRRSAHRATCPCPSPLGPVQRVGLCEICKTITPDPDPGLTACPSCRNSAGWSIRPLSRPQGFRTMWTADQAEPFETAAVRISRASTPRLVTPPVTGWDDTHTTRGLQVAYGHTQLWTVNDAGGNLFSLAPSNRPDGGFLVPEPPQA